MLVGAWGRTRLGDRREAERAVLLSGLRIGLQRWPSRCSARPKSAVLLPAALSEEFDAESWSIGRWTPSKLHGQASHPVFGNTPTIFALYPKGCLQFDILLFPC